MLVLRVLLVLLPRAPKSIYHPGCVLCDLVCWVGVPGECRRRAGGWDSMRVCLKSWARPSSELTSPRRECVFTAVPCVLTAFQSATNCSFSAFRCVFTARPWIFTASREFATAFLSKGPKPFSAFDSLTNAVATLPFAAFHHLSPPFIVALLLRSQGYQGRSRRQEASVSARSVLRGAVAPCKGLPFLTWAAFAREAVGALLCWGGAVD